MAADGMTSGELDLMDRSWPILTGSLALVLLFFTWWQQARLRRAFDALRESEKTLREQQGLLNSVLDNISEAIYRSSPEQGLIFANKAYLKTFGYNSLEDLRSVPREKLYANPADRKKLLSQLEATGAFKNEEILYQRKDGSTFWGLASSIAIYHPGTQKIDYHVGAITDITDRKQIAEELQKLNQELEARITSRTAELRASEARLRTIVEHAPEAIVVFSADTGRFLVVNENATKLFGRPRRELLNLTPADVSPAYQPDGRSSSAVAAEKTTEAMAGATPVFEWLHKRPDGCLVPTEVRLVRLPDEDKNLIRASILDTSERRRREKIQQATYQLSEAVHQADDLSALYKQIHSIVKTLMPADNLFFALSNPETGLFHFDYYIDEVDPPPAPRAIKAGLTAYVFRTGKALLATRESMTNPHSEWRLVSGTPSAIWLGVPLMLRGKPFGVMAVQDYQNPLAYGEEEKQILTFVAEQTALAIERKRAEQALRESEEKHRALFEATSQGVLLQDEERFLEVNSAALRILGYSSPGEILGRGPADFSAPIQANGHPAADLARKHLVECMTHGTARFDWISRRADGTDIPVEVILTRIQMGGRPLIQAVLNDITERKKAESELLKSLAHEKELSALKTNFVSMVSHEFRTPLGIIMSSAEILDSYLDQLEPVDRKDHLQSIQKSVRRMAELMEEVLLLSRAEAGKLDFTPDQVDLQGFTSRLVDEIHSATHRKCPVNLSVDRPEGPVLADERLLRHILINLLANAVKYSPEQSPVDFSLRLRDGRALFEVRDRGIGIPEQDQKWLFQAFHRGRNVGNIQGTGLGLVIVKRCVELHRGTIQIESVPGQGTRVAIEIPVAMPPDSPILGK